MVVTSLKGQLSSPIVRHTRIGLFMTQCSTCTKEAVLATITSNNTIHHCYTHSPQWHQNRYNENGSLKPHVTGKGD